MKKLFLISAAFLICGQASADCYSSGVRQGTIQKLSNKGMFMPSWEGEMVQSGISGVPHPSGVSSVVTNIWRFSITDPLVAKKVEDAMFKGGPLTVKYCQSRLRNPLRTDTPYEIVDVANVKN